MLILLQIEPKQIKKITRRREPWRHPKLWENFARRNQSNQLRLEMDGKWSEIDVWKQNLDDSMRMPITYTSCIHVRVVHTLVYLLQWVAPQCSPWHLAKCLIQPGGLLFSRSSLFMKFLHNPQQFHAFSCIFGIVWHVAALQLCHNCIELAHDATKKLVPLYLLLLELASGTKSYKATKFHLRTFGWTFNRALHQNMFNELVFFARFQFGTWFLMFQLVTGCEVGGWFRNLRSKAYTSLCIANNLWIYVKIYVKASIIEKHLEIMFLGRSPSLNHSERRHSSESRGLKAGSMCWLTFAFSRWNLEPRKAKIPVA